MDLREDPDKGVFVADLTYVVVDGPEAMDRVLAQVRGREEAMQPVTGSYSPTHHLGTHASLDVHSTNYLSAIPPTLWACESCIL
jgi:hypothetical protein